MDVPNGPPSTNLDLTELDRAASVLKAMAHPVRLLVLCGLLDAPATLTEMSRALSLPISTLSQHLEVLRRAHIIRGVRWGREVRYHVADERASRIMTMLCARMTHRGVGWESLAAFCLTRHVTEDA